MAARRKPLVIVANRLPVVRARVKGHQQWKRSPGGLVSALTPIVQRARGAWVGWTGSTGPAPEPFTLDRIRHLPVPLSRAQYQSFYNGFCNETIWPLYHYAVREPEYHRHWWSPYVNVNKRFAEITAKAAAKGGAVWIHDYHLQLVPALPWRRHILEGLLGADVVGFQTQNGAQNFLRLAQRYADARVEGGVVKIHDREVRVGAFPISTDFERYSKLAGKTAVIERSLELRQQVGKGRKIILGVDRLTKGIDVRLRAFRDLLSRREDLLQECVLVQLAVPSRERVKEYQQLRREVEELVGQINGEFGEVGMTPVQYLHRELPTDELVALYRAAEVKLVTPFADGMNLVAKEYVATRIDDTGVLILSEFAGAAHELKTALQVNPHDVDGLAETMDMAISLPAREVKRRMRRMRDVVRNHTVYDWADDFVSALTA
jgi:trehalose 6-phosphate synthase